MNNYLYKSNWITIISIIFFICGCGDDSDEMRDSISSNKVCTNWGMSQSEVMDYMNRYEIHVNDGDFICYIGKNDVQTISFLFQDDGLKTSLVLIPQDRISLSEIQSSFGKYEYLGAKNGIDVYVSETKNTMATVSIKVKGETAYYAIGYTELDLEAL